MYMLLMVRKNWNHTTAQENMVPVST